MMTCNSRYTLEQLHTYSTMFSSQTIVRSLRFSDMDDLLRVYQKYDAMRYETVTGWEYLCRIYRVLKRNYRNEYVYKNELINSFLCDKHCLRDTVVVNEFGVGHSIADIAMFNGCSKAFEIKSELDNDKRLLGQLCDYQKLFEECYVVLPEENYERYVRLIDERVGVYILSHTSHGAVSINPFRDALHNDSIDVNILMQSVRAKEYQWMVKQAFGELPQVSSFKMYDACKEALSTLSSDELHRLFNEAVKERNVSFDRLRQWSASFRQMFLGANLSAANVAKITTLYNHNLNL